MYEKWKSLEKDNTMSDIRKELVMHFTRFHSVWVGVEKCLVEDGKFADYLKWKRNAPNGINVPFSNVKTRLL